MFDARDRSAEPVSFGSWFKCSGNNFLAEMCAIVAAVLAVPAQADVCIYTDSQSCIDAVARDDSAEKRRLRAAARPMVTTLRRLIRSRGLVMWPSRMCVRTRARQTSCRAVMT